MNEMTFGKRLAAWRRRREGFGISALESAKAWLRRKAQRMLGVDKNYFQHALGADDYVRFKNEAESERSDSGLPVPPPRLWLGYATSYDDYLKSGRSSVDSMLGDMQKAGMSVANCGRMLDFGCGGGRMIRWLQDYAAKAEIWGVDISAEHIFWCLDNLTPPFHFATNTTLPHLPFDDGYFDFIYAGSVFTHIDDLAPAWLQELRRILSPDGFMYITIHDEHTVKIIDPGYVRDELPRVAAKTGETRQGQKNLSIQANGNGTYLRAARAAFNMIVYGRRDLSQVFFDTEYFAEKIASNLEVIAVNKESQYFQSAAIMRRRQVVPGQARAGESV